MPNLPKLWRRKAFVHLPEVRRDYTTSPAAAAWRAIEVFAKRANGGLIILGSALASVQRNLIIELAASHQLPAVYFDRLFVASGGLISYGADLVDQIGAPPATLIAS